MTADKTELTRDFEGALGKALISLSAHGEGVPLWWPAHLVVVLRRDSALALHGSRMMLGKWHKKGLEAPLFLAEHEITGSADVFPLEFLNLRLSCELLSGRDIFPALDLAPDDLRLQCERELKGKAVVLRRAYAASTLQEEFQALTAASLPMFLAVFRGLLHLEGLEPPLDPAKLLQATAGRFKLNTALFESLMEIGMGQGRKPKRDALHSLMHDYLAEAERLAAVADMMIPGKPGAQAK